MHRPTTPAVFVIAVMVGTFGCGRTENPAQDLAPLVPVAYQPQTAPAGEALPPLPVPEAAAATPASDDPDEKAKRQLAEFQKIYQREFGQVDLIYKNLGLDSADALQRFGKLGKYDDFIAYQRVARANGKPNVTFDWKPQEWPDDLFAERVSIVFDVFKADELQKIRTQLAAAANPAEPKPAAEAGKSGVAGATGTEAGKKLKALEAYDLLAPENSPGRNVLIKALGEDTHPGGKPMTVDQFDQKTPAERATYLTQILTNYCLSNIEAIGKAKTPALSADKIAEAKNVVRSAEYQAALGEIAQKIVENSGKFTGEFLNLIGLSDSDRKILNEKLKSANEQFNKDEKVGAESVGDRKARLLEIAREFVKTRVLDETTRKTLEPVLEQLALAESKPLGDGKPTPGNESVEELEPQIRGKIREIYRELGGFGRILGVFGLKGYFAGLIADMLVKRLGRALDEREWNKVQAMSLSLAEELHTQGPGGSQQPGGGGVQYPPQNPYGTWPTQGMPMVPVIPYGRVHSGHKSWHHRPMYVVPAMPGAYVVMPR